MKKSKIIVPAVALLALGMAASVTGTVAWFSIQNVVNANQVTTGTIASPDGGLTINVANPAGYTEGGTVDGNTISFLSTDNGENETDKFTKLTDVHVDQTSDKMYKVFMQDDGTLGSKTEITQDVVYQNRLGVVNGTHAYMMWGFSVTNNTENALHVDPSLPVGKSVAFEDATHAARIMVQQSSSAFSSLSGTLSGTVYRAKETTDDSAAHANAIKEDDATGPVYAATDDSSSGVVEEFDIASLAAGATKYFRVIVWLEGNDADCDTDAWVAGAAKLNSIKLTGKTIA